MVVKWQWPERSGRPSRKACFKGASHFSHGGLHGLCSSFHFTAWTDQVCNSSVWSTEEASFHSKRFQRESDVVQDILTMFHRCFSLKETASWSKWTTPRKAERRIRSRMQRFCLRGRLSINRKATCKTWKLSHRPAKLPSQPFGSQYRLVHSVTAELQPGASRSVQNCFEKNKTTLEQSCWELKLRLGRNHTTFQYLSSWSKISTFPNVWVSGRLGWEHIEHHTRQQR